MSGALAAGAALVALAAPGPQGAGAVEPSESPARAEPAPRLAERVEVAGMQAVVSVSRLVYVGHEDRPHELVALYVFPDRAKWYRALIGGSLGERQVEYRSGDACWRLDPHSAESRRLAPAERGELVRRMELRRALLLWPHGFEWDRRGSGAARADLGPLGHLEAALGEDGLPERLGSFDAHGSPGEALVELAWRDSEAAARALPTALTLELDGQPVWRETLFEVSTRARLLDFQFVPPDRPQFRDLPPGHPRAGLAGRFHELPARYVRRTPLEGAAGLADALERAAAVRAEVARSLPEGRGLLAGVELELTPGGSPRAVLVTLAGEPGPEPPAGFVRAPAERARTTHLDSPPPEGAEPAEEAEPGAGDPDPHGAAGALGSVLAELAGELPPGRSAGTPRLWFDPGAAGGGPGRLRLLLPLR